MKNLNAKNGFTLIELMVVVAIISILGSVAATRGGEAIARSKRATTLGNLATIRTALTCYAAEHDGKYPQFAPGEVGANYSPVLQLALVPTYLKSIPEAISPRGYHRTSSDVAAYWNQTGQDDNEQNGMGRGWKYDANPLSVSNTWGSIYVLCNHKDNLHPKGISWTSY